MQENEIEIDGLDNEVDATIENAVDEDVSEEDVSENEGEAEEAEDNGSDENTDVEQEMKTIRKALNKKNRYIDNLRARHRELEAEMKKLQETKAESNPPKETDYESVLDYLKAQQQYDLEQKFAEHGTQQQQTALQQQQQMLMQQINEQNHQKYQELAAANPDIKQTLESAETQQVIQSLPSHIDALFNEVDNPALAGYVLAKEGRLPELAYMKPEVALVEIVNAMHRGAQYATPKAKQSPVSKAPQPLSAAKGTGKISKQPHQMAGDELLKWVNS